MAATETRAAASKNSHATVKDITDDVRQLKTDVADTVTHAAEKGIEAVKHGADTAINASKRVAEKAGEAHESMCEYVKKNPTTSILIALGVGAVLSRILPRR